MEKKIRHILIPTDFSGYSNRAYHFALRLASAVNAKVSLLHVVEPPYNFATAVEGMLNIMETNAEKRLNMLIEKRAETPYQKVEISSVIKHGRTAREILKTIESEDVDLVIMGSKGQNAISRVVFGSVSAVVVNDADVPVIVMPESEAEKETNHLLFATNFREKDPENFLYTRFIADQLDANTEIIHVAEEMNFNTKLRHLGFKAIMKETTGEELDVTLKEDKDLLIGLAKHLQENPAALLVLNRYKKSVVQKLFGKNHTGMVLDYAHMPLLILP